MENNTKSPTLKEFSGFYLEIMKGILSPTTYDFYSRNIENYILPFFGNMSLSDINTYQVQRYIQKLVSGNANKGTCTKSKIISPSTVKRYLTVLKSILKQAYKIDLIKTYPARSEKLTIPKSKNPKIEIYTAEETAKILAALEHEKIQFRVLVNLAIYTGARRGELVALKFSDFDYDRHTVTIERSAYKLQGQPTETKPPKDYETRVITISPFLTEMVQDLQREKGRQKKGKDWLFTTSRGDIMNPTTPTSQFSKFLKKNGFKHCKFHALRHTSATLLLYSGVNIKAVQNRLGHNNIETTNKYLHYISTADKQAADALALLLEGKKNEIKIKA